MSTSEKRDFESCRDTSPLALEQLSERELELIVAIEQRLSEAKGIPCEVSLPTIGASRRDGSFAKVEDRHRRVLLLDGGRGTGKTSILLTLVKRWHASLGLTNGEAKPEREDIPKLGAPPEHIRVVRILDFDPLPPGMPILAGIVQALRPLAEAYDPEFSDETSYESDEAPGNELLIDLWWRLFRVAALGWSVIPSQSGLIEQVLDRGEQVQDWQQIADDWQAFVWKVLARAKNTQRPDRLTDDTVFVVMIDDVDLQVERIQELLPALRILYHPRVFFLVAADQSHMIDMLKLDFLGRQLRLANHQGLPTDAVTDAANNDRWASELAHSAFQKVFPRRNRWKLERLSCLEFLAFPKQVGSLPAVGQIVANAKTAGNEVGTFFDNLNLIEKASYASVANGREMAGEFILEFASRAHQMKLLPGVMPYRAAEQLRQYLGGTIRPFDVLARLLSQDTDERPAVVEPHGGGVQVTITGELAALYRPGLTDLGGPYNVVLSARPDFVFSEIGKDPIRMSTERDNRFNFTGALIAKMLEEGGFPVDAAGLRWETYLSLAWTEWRFSGLSFAWTRHTHPRPDQLLEQTQAWAEFIKAPIESANKWERYAYAWIYHQRRLNEDRVDQSLDPLSCPDGSLPWDKLLTFSPTENPRSNPWLRHTLPLLARPELGFPSEVQERLLSTLPSDEAVKRELKRERRQLVTDAVVAAKMQRGERDWTIPTDPEIEEMIRKIDRDYSERNEENWWSRYIEPTKTAPKKTRAAKE